MVQNTGLKPFSARKQAVIHQGKLRGFFLKLVKNTREKLVLPRKILARVREGRLPLSSQTVKQRETRMIELRSQERGGDILLCYDR